MTEKPKTEIFDNIRLVLSRQDITAADKVILIYLFDRVGGNGQCWPGMETIRKGCGLKSKGTVDTSLRTLEKMGFLDIERPDKPSNGNTNHYSINITGLKNRPVQKIDRSKKYTRTGLKNRLEPVQKIDSNVSITTHKQPNYIIPGEKKSSKFQKPSPAEVSDYARSIGFELDGGYFIDSYEAKGWLVGKNKMTDWKAAVRTWKHNQGRFGQQKKQLPKITMFSEQESDYGIEIVC